LYTPQTDAFSQSLQAREEGILNVRHEDISIAGLCVVAEDKDYGDFVKWVESDPKGTRVQPVVTTVSFASMISQLWSPGVHLCPTDRTSIQGPATRRQASMGACFLARWNPFGCGFNVISKVDVLEVKAMPEACVLTGYDRSERGWS